MKFFTNCHSLDELKAEYRKLVKLHHPDRGGDPEIMKAINNEYEKVFEQLKKHHNETHDEQHQTTETAAEFIEIIEKLMHMEGIEAELCGSWIWCRGNTYEYKDQLKAMGFQWSKAKKSWHWHHPEETIRHYRGKSTMEQIREKYGSQIYQSNYQEARLGATA